MDADWIKFNWDLPPYMSPEFLALGFDLATFRKSPAYRYAVAVGLILDDEWVPDFVELASDSTSDHTVTLPRGVKVTHHYRK